MFIDIIFSKILEKPLVKDIGRKFNWLFLVGFLCTGMTNDIFHCFGTSDNAREQLKISDKWNINAEIVCLIKYGGIFEVF